MCVCVCVYAVPIFVATVRRAYQDHNLYGYCPNRPKTSQRTGKNNSSDKQAMKSNKLRVKAAAAAATIMPIATVITTTAIGNNKLCVSHKLFAAELAIICCNLLCDKFMYKCV